MKNVFIKEPIWHNNSIGVNHKWITDDLAIEILYCKADGTRLYPDTFRMTREEALSYPIQEIMPIWTDKKIKLHIIPISSLKVESEDERLEREYKQSQGL